MNKMNKFDYPKQRYQQYSQGKMQGAAVRQSESDNGDEYDEDNEIYDEQQQQQQNGGNGDRDDLEYDRFHQLPNNNNYNTFNNNQQQYNETNNQLDYDSQIIDNPLDETPIQVMIRVRPQFNIDIQSALKIVDNNSIYINNNETIHQFKYSRVFKPSDQQETIFKYVCEPILQHAIQGFNASFLVYGQTGTGKTHTMGLHQNNLLDEPGMIQHSLKFLFDYFNNNSQLNQDDWQISISFMQIYIEEIFDLLNPSGQKLQIREDTESNEVYVQNLITVPIKSMEQALKLIEAGLNYRMLGPQNMNQHSSRSHTILNVYLQQKISFSEYVVSNIAFVDLAGSERIKKSNSTGIRMEEAKKINSSLSALSNVISLLGDSNAQHIPYRDSKLTRILQNCLNSQSKISIIGTIEPSEDNSFESYSTLLFASRCQDIQFLPQQNLQNIFTMHSDPQEEIMDLKEQIKYYQNKLKTIQSPQDNGKIAKSILSIFKKYYPKISKNQKSQINRNDNLDSKRNQEISSPKIPFEELTQLLNDNKESEFLNIFESSIEDIFTKYSQLQTELEKQKELNSQLRKDQKKNEKDDQLSDQLQQNKLSQPTRLNIKLVTDIIEYYSGHTQSLINQLLESEQILEYTIQSSTQQPLQQQINEYLQSYQYQTHTKLKEIIQQYHMKDLSHYINNLNEQNYSKISKLESYRIKQLILHIKKTIEDQSNLNQNNSKINTNIKDFLEKQKSLNDKKFLVQSNNNNILSNSSNYFGGSDKIRDHSNPSSSMSVRSGFISNNNNVDSSNNNNNINNTSVNNNNSQIKGSTTNLKQMMNDISVKRKQNTSSNNNNYSGGDFQNPNNNNQENISSQIQQDGSNVNIQIIKQNKPIHIQRVKILDEDINQNDRKNEYNNQERTKLTEQNTNINKKYLEKSDNNYQKDQSISFQQQSFQSINQQQLQLQQQLKLQNQEQKNSLENNNNNNHNSNSSSRSNLTKKTDMYNTADLPPIPSEQTLNSQLKSYNVHKKNQKYSPFIDS